MYHASSEQHRKLVSAVVKAASRIPKPIRGMDARRFLQTYYANGAPEPSTYALTFAGLGLLGFLVRRKSARFSLLS